MPTTIESYSHLSELIANGLFDLDGITIKLALVSSAYTPDVANHTQWGDVSANEISGTGYTTGGATIQNTVLTRTGKTATLDGDDVLWSALNATFRFGVAYAQGTFGSLTDPLLFYILFDDTPADITVNGVDFRVVWSSSGILTVSTSP